MIVLFLFLSPYVFKRHYIGKAIKIELPESSSVTLFKKSGNNFFAVVEGEQADYNYWMNKFYAGASFADVTNDERRRGIVMNNYITDTLVSGDKLPTLGDSDTHEIYVYDVSVTGATPMEIVIVLQNDNTYVLYILTQNR